jgi:hypothetical protein
VHHTRELCQRAFPQSHALLPLAQLWQGRQPGHARMYTATNAERRRSKILHLSSNGILLNPCHQGPILRLCLELALRDPRDLVSPFNELHM